MPDAVTFLAAVDAKDVIKLARWIARISFTEWPQQKPLVDGSLRPAMVGDRKWHRFGEMTDPLVSLLMSWFPGCQERNRMLSVVMPGHEIPAHKDEQGPEWVTRVHLPLTSNDQTVFAVEDIVYGMLIGFAYMVDIRKEHYVKNWGRIPRVHLMFDVVKDLT